MCGCVKTFTENSRQRLWWPVRERSKCGSIKSQDFYFVLLKDIKTVQAGKCCACHLVAALRETCITAPTRARCAFDFTVAMISYTLLEIF